MKYLTSVDNEMDETANSEGDPAPAALSVGWRVSCGSREGW